MTDASVGRAFAELLEDGESASVRPATVTLARDVRALLDDLEGGFASEREIVAWLGRIVTRTLGEIEERVLTDIARQLRGDTHGPLVAAFLVPAARDRDEITEDVARELRESFRATFLLPALHRAYRDLRKDATEYGAGGEKASRNDGGDTTPGKQSFIAMRPALNEIERYQQTALEALLAGFGSTADLLSWGELLEIATDGEIPEDFAAKCYREKGARSTLLGDEPDDERARLIFAAWFILPLFRKGVRSRRRRAGEVPSHEKEQSGGKFA